MNDVIELYGHSVESTTIRWRDVVRDQVCPFMGAKCYKVRKSDPTISIGTCTVGRNAEAAPAVICPARLLERRQVFTDCLHLLTLHEPGNEYHIVPEITIPGGRVDYVLISAAQGEVKDFVGIELQALDTTGTVWPARQRLLARLGMPNAGEEPDPAKPYGLNWKMTAKTTLMQAHHKVETFDHLQKKLVLVLQDCLLDYMVGEFDFRQMRQVPVIGDSMHIHSYTLALQQPYDLKIQLSSRLSTNAAGVAACLGLQADPHVELDGIISKLQARLSTTTLFQPV